MDRIRFSGTGGQGVLLAGIITAHAFILDNKFACQTAAYGSQVRGMITTVDVIADDSFIDFPGFDEPDALVAFSQKGYDAYIQGTSEKSKVFYDSTLVRPEEIAKSAHYSIAAQRIALEKFKDDMIANMIMLGFLWKNINFVPQEPLIKAVQKNVGAKYAASNIDALKYGMEWNGPR